MRLTAQFAAAVAASVFAAAAAAQQVLRLHDFESPADVKAWDFTAGTGKLVTEGVTHGQRAMEITFDPKGQYQPGYIFWRRVRRDWSAFDALALDVLNPSDRPIPGYLLVADKAWADKGRTYWNRHNGQTTFAPGRTKWVLPVRGLYRGEAGSRNNDIKRNIDPDSIVRVDFGFGRKGARGRVVIDNLRLIKGSRPKGVWAFDFGPPSQSVMLGWTGVSQASRYTKARGFGWGPAGGVPWNGAARDTTFASALLRDFCECGGYRFRVDVPPGRYRVTIFYENAGYWGGEQAMHGKRRIAVDGREVFSRSRPDGPAHALYRFENVEPVGVDLWDTYMKTELAEPIAFTAAARREGLTLHFHADRVWGSKLAALALHRADDAKAAKWLAGQLEAMAAEFRGKAVCLDKPVGKFVAPPAWRDSKVTAWAVRVEEDVTPHSLPPAGAAAPEALALSALAARGESETLCLAVRLPDRAGKEQEGPMNVDFAWHDGPGRLKTQVYLVWYNTRRGFNTIAYRVRPHTLRRADKLLLRQGVTRELVVKVCAAADAAPGLYRGELKLTRGGQALVLSVPVRLRVAGVSLDRATEFQMGFFGLMPTRLVPKARRWQVLDETLRMLAEYGMNMVSGGPSWRLTGWRKGRPVIDFGEMDRFFTLLRKHGFTGPLNGYGGARFVGLHDGYQKGHTGEKVEKEIGLPYAEAMLRAWRAVHEHARANHWPVIHYAMCDETRVRDVAQRELAFMNRMAKVSAAFPTTVRTSGSYSVHFNTRPTDKNSLLYWHQRFFEAMDISSLNVHDPSTLAEARRLGKQLHIYNQGRTRYTFGLYQWSEFRKGVRSRCQWHLNILHGYQFFDLDGREPDNAMICYGRKGLYPTIDFERCREGAEDFYLYNTLWKILQRQRRRGRKGAALDAAAKLLDDAVNAVKLNHRQAPAGFDPATFKAKVVAAIEALARS